MATRKAVIKAAVDSIKPLHLRRVCALGGRTAYGGRGGVGTSLTGGTRTARGGSNRLAAAAATARGAGAGSSSSHLLVGPSRASLVQGGSPAPLPAATSALGQRGRPSPSLVQGRPAPSLVQGRPTGGGGGAASTVPAVNGASAKLNGVPSPTIQTQYKYHQQQQQQNRADLVRGRRSTLNGVVKLANGERVAGALPAYLLRHQQPRQQQQYQQQQHQQYRGGQAAGTAVVTDLSANGQHDDSGGDENDSSYESDLVVVLDMDECIIHSQFLSQEARSSFSAPDLDSSATGNDGDGDSGGDENDTTAASGETMEMEDKYRQPDIRPTKSTAFHTDEEAESIIASNCEYFRIHLPDGDLVHVNKRPNLDMFLAEVTARFETHIFTAAMEVYANPLLDRLESDLGTTFAGRFYREHCILDPDLGVYIKDLGLILDKSRESGSDWGSAYNDDYKPDEECKSDDSESDLSSSFDERRVVLVDNNPLSFLANPSNGILVSNFYDDPKDATLDAVMELLHELDEAEDVRPVLESKFGLKDALRDVVRSTNSWR